MRKYSSITRENSRQTSRRERVRVLVGVGVVALLLFYLIPRVVGGAASFIFLPVAQFESWFYNSGIELPQYFVDRQELIDEIKKLEAEIEQSSKSTQTIKRLEEENADLRGVASGAVDDRILASVVGRPTTMPYDVLVLDKGSRDGIVKNAPVYAGKDQVIGFVGEVHHTSAVVVLATTPGFESTVYIFGPNIYTTAEGFGGGVLKVSVPQEIVLREGDVVVMPSLEGGVFGNIEVVESLPTDPEQRGYVTLSVPLQSLRLVSVGKSEVVPISFEEASEIVNNVRRDLTTVPVPQGILVDVIEDTGTSTATTTDEIEAE